MSKINEIVQGFKYGVFPNEKVEKLAIERAKTCSTCEHNVRNRSRLCGCILMAKTRSPQSKCPAGKWKK